MSDVIPFKKPEPLEPHMHGECVCISCTHQWQGVAPIGATWLECPKCHTNLGRFKNYVERGSAVWNCACGNDLFRVAPEGIYCPVCGEEQVFP